MSPELVNGFLQADRPAATTTATASANVDLRIPRPPEQ